MKYVLFFGECGEQDFPLIGRKGVNLSMLFKRGFKVPPGFILSAKAFEILKQDRKIKQAITDMFAGKSSNLNELLKDFEFPEEIEDEIIEAYLSLSVDLNMNASSLLETKEVFVAVRSSAIDQKNMFPEISHKTILNIKSKKKLFRAILEDYYNMIMQAAQKHKDAGSLDDLSIAIIIQKMVNSEKSGIASSVDEETSQKHIVIKACFGLGEGLASGNVFPDIYKVDKKTLTLEHSEIAEKQFEFVRDIETNQTVRHRLGEKSMKQVLSDNETAEIARVVKKIVAAFGKEIKIEWAIKKDGIYVLQMKDVKLESKETVEMEILPEKEEESDDEIIDIEDVDLDDDLEMLKEIEEYENKEERDEQIPGPEPGPEEEEQEEDRPEYTVHPEIVTFKEDEEEKVEAYDDMPAETDDKDEDIEEEEVKEESIFGNFDSFKMEDNTTLPPLNKFNELAKLNSANTLVFCHMAIKDRLRQRLGKHVNELPEGFSDILDELMQYVSVENEDELRNIDKAVKEFIDSNKYPEPEIVALGLKMI